MNDEHTAAYWMQKTMDAAHEAYDRLKDTVDFKNAIAEVEAIKQRMGITKKKKITNGERICQMTDEELAEFLLESRSRCKLCKKRDEICEGAYHECWNGIDDWLKQEVQDAEKE